MTKPGNFESRSFWLGACLVCIGSILAGFIFGLPYGSSFLAGGLLSAANMAMLRHSINTALQGSKRSKFRMAATFILRLLLIPVCLYAIMRFFFLGVIAATAGFAAFSCGIFLEGVFEAFKTSAK
jgi:hypothetical protein